MDADTFLSHLRWNLPHYSKWVCLTKFYVFNRSLKFVISFNMTENSGFPTWMPSIPQYKPDSKVHGANIDPTWGLSAPDEPHVGPMNLAIREPLAIHFCIYYHSFTPALLPLLSHNTCTASPGWEGRQAMNSCWFPPSWWYIQYIHNSMYEVSLWLVFLQLCGLIIVLHDYFFPEYSQNIIINTQTVTSLICSWFFSFSIIHPDLCYH